MKSQETLMGTFMLAGAMLMFTLSPVSGAGGHGKGPHDQSGKRDRVRIKAEKDACESLTVANLLF